MDHIRKTVRDFFPSNTDNEGRRYHIHDLKYCALKLYNYIIEKTRQGMNLKNNEFIAVVLNTSTVINDAALASKVGEDNLKDQVRLFFFQEEKECRLPTKVTSFTALQAKRSGISEGVIALVCNMYRIQMRKQLLKLNRFHLAS